MDKFVGPLAAALVKLIQSAFGLPDNWKFIHYKFTSSDELTIKLSRKPRKDAP